VNFRATGMVTINYRKRRTYGSQTHWLAWPYGVVETGGGVHISFRCHWDDVSLFAEIISRFLDVKARRFFNSSSHILASSAVPLGYSSPRRRIVLLDIKGGIRNVPQSTPWCRAIAPWYFLVGRSRCLRALRLISFCFLPA